MATKKYDLAVKVGSYTDASGETKNRYENIGAVLQGDNGPFIMLKKTFNPAGVPDERGGESIIVSCFEPKERQQAAPAPAAAPTAQPTTDDIPF